MKVRHGFGIAGYEFDFREIHPLYIHLNITKMANPHGNLTLPMSRVLLLENKSNQIFFVVSIQIYVFIIIERHSYR